MKAIILAAGRGSRLNQLTEERPKCLVQISGKSLLEWQLESLERTGITQVGIVAGYRSEMLTPFSNQIFLNSRWSETNMVQSLTAAEQWLQQETCLISYSDIAYHPSIVMELQQSIGDIAITYDRLWLKLWEKRFENPLSDAESFILDEQGTLVEIGKKTERLSDIQGQYMGLLKTTPTGWKKILNQLEQLSPVEKDKLDMTSLLNLLLKNKNKIHTVGIHGKWCEVDNQIDLQIYEHLLRTSGWSHDFRF